MTKQPNLFPESRKVQKPGQMRSILIQSSRSATLFGFRFGLANHFIAWCRSNHRSFLPPWRFSARFGHTRWCTNLLQNGQHHPTHLPGSDQSRSSFPGTIQGLPQRAGQHQLVHGCGYHQAPALKLLRSAHAHFRPEEILLEKAIGVLVREAASIRRCHLSKRKLVQPDPNKPTLPGVAFGVMCSHAHDTIDDDFDLSRLSKMQMPPGLHLDRPALLIYSRPGLIGRFPRFWSAALKQRSILARCPASAFGWSRSIQLAIALEAHQRPDLEPMTGLEKRSCHVPAISQQANIRRQECFELLQLLDSDCYRRLVAANAALRENGSPTAGLSRQQHDGRELPSYADRLLGMGQVGNIDHPAIWARLSFGAGNTGTINADPHCSLLLFKQSCRPDLTPAALIDASILHGFVATGPLAPEGGRQRPFRQRTSRCFTQQGICQIEEGIGTAIHTAIDLMTQLLQCVKVQSVNVLCSCGYVAKHFTSSGSFWQSRSCLLLSVV